MKPETIDDYHTLQEEEDARVCDALRREIDRGLPAAEFKAAEQRYTDVSQVDARLLGRWLKESQAIQWDYKNIVKRKGKLERLK